MGIHMKNNINYTGATSLNTLRDVVIDSPATGQGIVWDEEKQQWTNGEVSTNDMVEITLAEYEALSTEEKNNDTTYFITDADNIDPGNVGTVGTLKPWLYDTENEVVIGVYDGKPLYRKFFTINVTCAANSLTAYTLSDYLSDYNNIIAYKAYIDYNTPMPLPIYIAGTTGSYWSYNIALEVTNDRITVSTGSEVQFTNQDALIMVEYTKTTDAEGSGVNLMPYSFVQNASNIYSTEEQIVGKWVDGKPLYQKTSFYQNYALSSGYNELPLDVNNVDVVVDTKAYVSNSSHTNYRPMNSYTLGDDDNSIYYIVNIESNVLYLVTKTFWSSPNIHFTIQYTKTTD